MKTLRLLVAFALASGLLACSLFVPVVTDAPAVVAYQNSWDYWHARFIEQCSAPSAVNVKPCEAFGKALNEYAKGLHEAQWFDADKTKPRAGRMPDQIAQLAADKKALLKVAFGGVK
jgi:hypothetical protein